MSYKAENKIEIKVKHLPIILSKKIDYALLMKDFGYKNNWLHRKLFAKKFLKVFNAVRDVAQCDVQKLKLNEHAIIKPPKNIDNISLRQMIEIRSWMGNGQLDTYTLLRNIIAVACYTGTPYDSESNRYKRLLTQIDNQPALDMIALFDHITAQVKTSQQNWQSRFDSVEIVDEDYQLAGGSRMEQFNIINTIRGLCKDFNCTYDDAWQLPYAVTQTRAYADASAAYTQDQMTGIKKLKMEAESKKKGGR